MRTLSIGTVAIVLAAVLALLVPAEAQAPLSPSYVEKATGINFPATIGLLAFEGAEEYEDESLGVAISYSTGAVTATIYVYNAGLAAIPSGADSRVHKEAVAAAVNDIKQVSGQGTYQDLVFGREEVLALAGRTDGHRARHASLAYSLLGVRCHSHIFVLGYKNQLIKLRFSYPDESRTIGEEQLDALTKWLDGEMK